MGYALPGIEPFLQLPEFYRVAGEDSCYHRGLRYAWVEGFVVENVYVGLNPTKGTEGCFSLRWEMAAAVAELQAATIRFAPSGAVCR